MPRENSKCRKWEKERRERLKEAFSELAKLLPCYVPSVNIPKIDILQKAASTIQKLEDNIKNLLSSNTEKKAEKENIIKKLHDRIKKLLVRNEQLSNILRDAGITVPSACGTIKKFKNQLHWSKKISAEQAKLLQKNEMEKENISSKLKHGKKKKTKILKMGITAKHQTVLKGVEQKEVFQKKKKRNKNVPASNCFIVLSQPTPTIRRNIGQQYYLIANDPTNTMYKNIIKSGVTNSGINLKPMPITSKSRGPKSLILTNPSIPSLGPGSLILPNGTLLPMLSSFQMIPTLSDLLLNLSVSTFPKINNIKDNECNQKHFSTKSESHTSVPRNVKTLPAIQPKYCLTRTTQVNKVPIPALTSRYANTYFFLNETKPKCVKLNEAETMKKSNKINQVQDPIKSNKKRGEKRKNDDEGESSSKKSRNESTNNLICPETSDDLINTSATSNNILVTEDDIINLKATNKIDPKEVGNNLIEHGVSGKVKGEHKFENNTETKEQLENIDIPVNTSGNFEKKQESVKNASNENSHQEITFASTTVTVTALTTTTTHEDIKHLDLNLSHSELSNDIFASLQVPSGCQNPDSTSPTAAFLLAFPLVSSGIKVTEVIDEEISESQRGTPTLLQIGTMDSTKPTQSQSDTITSNFLNLDSFSFFSSKDICGENIYNHYSNIINKTSKSTSPTSMLNTNNKSDTATNKSVFINIKSPCLPTCVAEPVKENYNLFNEKPTATKDVRNIDGCEKRSNKIKDSINFNSHNQSKVNTNYVIHSKNITNTDRQFEQKSQFYVPTTTTYTNTNCNLNYKSEPSKMCTTCSYNNRNYTNPLYTNCSNYNYNYNYHPDTNFNQNYYKNIPRNEVKNYYLLKYENYSDYRKNETTALTGRYDTSTYIKDKKHNNSNKVKTNQNKIPINWMTTPDSRLQPSECLLNSFSKGDFSQTYPFGSYVTSSSTYFTTTSKDTNNVNYVMEPKKCSDLPIVSLNSHQRPDTEEKQFSWSPTKLPHFLDPPHNFVTSTLPTLVGDLALGNPLTFGEQKNDYNKHLKDNKDIRRMNRVSNCENQTNFFSVSQLVEQNKPENVPAKTSTRRNSGNRSKNSAQHKVKRVAKHENKDLLPNCGNNSEKISQIRFTRNYNGNEIFQEQKSRNSHKNASSSYSAEALIGHQIPDESITKRYPPTSKPSNFLAENIISYFPPVDLPQENYMSQNQNYATSNFTHNLSTSFQNNTYSTNSFIYTAPTITSTYLSTNTFEPSSHDYLQDNLNLMQNSSVKDKQYNTKNLSNRQQNKEDKIYEHTTVCSNNFRRSKKKSSNEGTNGLANFDFPFLSIPGSNNSPILPDDFHSHTNFLPPTTLFSCKNSIYPKQSNDITTGSLLPLPSLTKSNIQHPEISPSMNSVGTSLTNFNLSTIFPEINKGPVTEIYTDGRIKEHSHTKSYTCTSQQVPFNTEPKFSFSS